MPKRVRNKELEILHRGSGVSGRTRDARELPPFISARAGKHTRVPGRGRHKAKKG